MVFYRKPQTLLLFCFDKLSLGKIANACKESSRILLVLIGLTISLCVCFTAAAATVYTYRDENGQILITNKKPSNSKSYELVKSISFVPYRDRKSNNPYFSKARKSQYDSLIINLSNKYSMDPALVKAVIHIESAFRHDAVSRAGAMGLMQLMPATARSYDLHDDQFDPKKNITVGVTHLKMRLRPLDSQQVVDGICFSYFDKHPEAPQGIVRLAYKLDVNEFRNRLNLQLMIQHVE